jgi:hypothetical protein
MEENNGYVVIIYVSTKHLSKTVVVIEKGAILPFHSPPLPPPPPRSTAEPVFLNFKGPGIEYAIKCSLAGWYDYSIPTWFLVPINCSIIPVQASGQRFTKA